MRTFVRSVAVLLALATAVVQAQTVETTASGLANPRGLNFGPDGALYVMEAGSGGDGECGPGAGGSRCYGTSSAVIRLDVKKGTMTRTGLAFPSLAGASGNSATGAHDISFQGRGNGFITIGFGGPPNNRMTYWGAEGMAFSRLARMTANGSWSLAENLGNYEQANDPDGHGPDTNPYGVLALPGKVIVADAGANALLEVSANGSIRTLAVFPNRTATATPPLPPVEVTIQAVPTCVALGPDGNYYVGQLTGGPFPVGAANIYRVSPNGGTPEVAASGFSAVIDIAFGPDGSMYVLQISNNLLVSFGGGPFTGSLIKVSPGGTRTEIAAGQLTAPGGVAVGPDGALYVTNMSVSATAGQVLRIVP